jgi:polyisoprenyl-phosphate glycosyltransferase
MRLTEPSTPDPSTPNPSTPERSTTPLVSIVLPVYNEATILEILLQELTSVLVAEPYEREILFVNDGSTDGSAAVLNQIAQRDPHVRVIHLSRNFGHQAAVHAGLSHARGDAVVVMDSDLQDAPSAIHEFLAHWEAGAKVVYAIRHKRKEAWWKRGLFYAYYRILNRLVTTPLPEDAGNFSLLDRVALNQLLTISDCDRYFPGLRHWVGFQQVGVAVERRARHDEHPRVSLNQLFQLAKTALFGFSRAPLSMFYGIAALSFCVFLGCSAFALYHRLITHLAIPGWTSITMIVALFGALNAFGISVLGEYVVRIYDQVRQRPAYVVADDTARSYNTLDGTRPHRSLEWDVVDQIEDLSREVQATLGSPSKAIDDPAALASAAPRISTAPPSPR